MYFIGHSVNYRDYFHHVKGDFKFYENGKLNKRLIVQRAKVKFAQVWNAAGEEVLSEGTGENRFVSNDQTEDVFEADADSALIEASESGGKRTTPFTIPALPEQIQKEGKQIFYQN